MSDVVCNASPLIVLAKADLLRLMPKLFERTFVPQAVLDEILAGPAHDPMRRTMPDASWVVRVRLEPPLSPLSTWSRCRTIRRQRGQKDLASAWKSRLSRGNSP